MSLMILMHVIENQRPFAHGLLHLPVMACVYCSAWHLVRQWVVTSSRQHNAKQWQWGVSFALLATTCLVLCVSDAPPNVIDISVIG